MAPAPLLIILKACCFISCECQISAIYIPQLLHASEWLLILPKMNGSDRVELKTKRQKGARGGGGCERWRNWGVETGGRRQKIRDVKRYIKPAFWLWLGSVSLNSNYSRKIHQAMSQNSDHWDHTWLGRVLQQLTHQDFSASVGRPSWPAL